MYVYVYNTYIVKHPSANLRTEILDFRGLGSSIINIKCKGWNSHGHGELPGSFESSILSRDNISIGRLGVLQRRSCKLPLAHVDNRVVTKSAAPHAAAATELCHVHSVYMRQAYALAVYYGPMPYLVITGSKWTRIYHR